MQPIEPTSAYRITPLKVPPLQHLLLGSLNSGLGDLTSLISLNNGLETKLARTDLLSR
jgi:hypothetical protein